VLIRLFKSNYLLLVLAACFWGGNFVVGKAMVSEIPPITLALLRWFVALLVVSPFFGKAVWKERRLYVKHWKTVVFLALVGVAGFNTLLYIAVQYTGSINASLMNAATPIIIVILSILFLRERFSAVRLIGILVSLGGVLWIVSRGSKETLLNLAFNKGDLWMLIAVILWAIYSIGVKKSIGIFPSTGIFTVTIWLTVILLLPLSLIELNVRETDMMFSWNLLIGLLYVGIFASVAAFTSWNLAVSRLGPSRCASFLNLIPLFSAIFATLFTDENVQIFHYIGAFLIICGVYITTKIGKN
jgi:drug/metabolite transporter (DMT)-like permease